MGQPRRRRETAAAIGKATCPASNVSRAIYWSWEIDMEMKLELIGVPVSDVDVAKAFYSEKLGFNADFDQTVNENPRFVQLTPPGSACSICIGIGLTKMPPGSVDLLQMVVPDAQKAHDELA